MPKKGNVALTILPYILYHYEDVQAIMFTNIEKGFMLALKSYY